MEANAGKCLSPFEEFHLSFTTLLYVTHWCKFSEKYEMQTMRIPFYGRRTTLYVRNSTEICQSLFSIQHYAMPPHDMPNMNVFKSVIMQAKLMIWRERAKQSS